MADDIVKTKSKNRRIKNIIWVIILLTLANLFAYPVVGAQVKIYLSLKYKELPSKFELVDHNQSHFTREEYEVFFTKTKWVDFSFEYKYNDRLFFVNRDKGRFYDDYQLEDIENWCTKWLQDNVDERFVGIDLNSEHIREYQRKFNYKKLNKSVTKDFLYYYFSGYLDDFYMASFYDESLNRDAEADLQRAELSNAIISKLNIDEKGQSNIVYLSQEKNYESDHIKGIDMWITYSN